MHVPVGLPPVEGASGTRCIGGWAGHTADMGGEVKINLSPRRPSKPVLVTILAEISQHTEIILLCGNKGSVGT
jgi:hypothetical protein